MKVGINGFGRIGKLVYQILRKRGIEVPLVNDPFINPDAMAYLLKYDSTHGKSKAECRIVNGKLIFNGQPTNVTAFKDPKDIPWSQYGVDYVVESTGIFKSKADAGKHKDVKCVVVTAPSPDAPMYVYGVNHTNYSGENVVSNASCTTNCLAPLAKVINDAFGIQSGLMTTVHAVTATQKIVDGVNMKSLRDGRSGMQNIVPSSTGAAVAVCKVLPELSGRLNGMAMRVPVSNVSVVDLTVSLERETSLDGIIKAINDSKNSMEGVIDVCDHEAVSSDFIGDERSCVFDKNASMDLNGKFFKLVAWYDNEYGYSCRVCDLLKYISTKKN